jgi:hypothetical protein
MATWKTALGATTAVYTLEQEGRLVEGAGFRGETDQFFNILQAVSFGSWRVSAGASLTVLENTSLEDAFADDAFSGTFSVRYAPSFGPKFDARLGRTQDEMAFDADEFMMRSQATTLAVSIDLSDYVQRQLDRRDTHLKLQYRHQLHQSELSINE